MREGRRISHMFRQWFFAQMHFHKKMRFGEAMYAGAETVNCSSETIRRLLLMMTSSTGMYVIIKDPQGIDCIYLKNEI
jgi:hypothetical protein